jgi:hypothetical protein
MLFDLGYQILSHAFFAAHFFQFLHDVKKPILPETMVVYVD